MDILESFSIMDSSFMDASHFKGLKEKVSEKKLSNHSNGEH